MSFDIFLKGKKLNVDDRRTREDLISRAYKKRGPFIPSDQNEKDKIMKHPGALGFIYKCQLYAKAHGYYGQLGGWIYHESAPTTPVCQGWVAFYKTHGRSIEKFLLNRYNNYIKDKTNDK